MRRHLVVVLVIIVLVLPYIAPANLMPYSDPLASVQQPQEAKDFQPSESFIKVTIDNDDNDDFWNLLSGSWTHYTDNGSGSHTYEWIHNTWWELPEHDPANGQDYGQVRFQLPIPQGSTIVSANLSLYEGMDNAVATSNVYRIDETNVGPLEQDTSKPEVTGLHSTTHSWDDTGAEWTNINVTDMTQDQVNLEQWVSGAYIGFQMNITTKQYKWMAFEDFEAAGTNHAYLNVSYVESAGPNWLSGWHYRVSHTILQTAGTGEDYTVPHLIHRQGGTHSEYNAYISPSKVKSDFADIRFTTIDGTTQLDHRLNRTVSSSTTDYFIDEARYFATYKTNYPSAYYYDGLHERTYVVFQGDLSASGSDIDIYITYYDHESEEWSGIYYVGENPLVSDDHGGPVVWVNNTGYIHVIWGAHNTDFEFAVSDRPEDISSWTQQADIDCQRCTYPAVSYDSPDNVVHLLYRARNDSQTHRWIYYRNSTDSGQSWSTEQPLVKSYYVSEGDHHGIYRWMGGLDDSTDNFHFAWAMDNVSEDRMKNVYYAYLDTDTGILYNVTGDTQGTLITPDEWDNCLVETTPDPDIGENQITEYLGVRIDGDGDPYLMWQQCMDTSQYAARFKYWNSTSSAWSTTETVVTCDGVSRVQGNFIVHDDDNVTAFISDYDDQGIVDKWTWNGTDWTETHNIISDSNDDFARSTIVGPWDGGGSDELQVIVSRTAGSPSTPIEAYAYGTGGIIQRTPAPYGEFYVEIPVDLSTTDYSLYVYYGNLGAATASNGSLTLDTGNDPNHGTWGDEESSYYDYVDNNDMDRDTSSDIGTHSDFENEQYGPDSQYDTLTEANTAIPSDDHYDQENSDIDSSSDVGTQTSPANANDSVNSQYMNLQEANQGGGSSSEWIYIDGYVDSQWTEVGSPEYIDAQDQPTNYIWTNGNADVTGWSTFGATAGTGTLTVNLSIYWYADGDGYLEWELDWTGDDTADDSGSFAHRAAYGWDNTGTITGLDTVSEINACRLRLTNNKGGGGPDNNYVDAARLGASWTASDDYELDFEYSWTSATYDLANENLSIYVQTATQSGETLKAWEWTGSDWSSLGAIDTDTWNNFSLTYLTSSTFYILINDTDQSGDTTQNSWNIDLITLTTSGNNYELELEVGWYAADYDEENEYLCIRTGTLASENLTVSVWNNTVWTFLFNLTANSWNNISVSNWLTNVNLTILYNDTTESGDTMQNTWQIDVALLHLYPSANVAPVNDQAAVIENLDDSDNMYAQYKHYYLEVNVSDGNGAEDIHYVEVTLTSNDRLTEYWTIRFNNSGNTFTNETDLTDVLELNSGDSSYYESGNSLDVTFSIMIDWGHTDIADTDIKQVVVDNNDYYDTDWYEINYDVETRLDMSSGPTLNDGSGTTDRGDIDGSITASGTVIYYGGTTNPLAAEIDMWISASEYGTQTGPWNATNLANDGTFSHTVYADDVVGQDTYTFKAVIQSAGAGGTDLMQATQQDTYIADRLNITIEADSETPDNAQQVNFTLTVEFDYDDSTCTTYTIQIARNLTAWYEFTNANKSLFNDTNSATTYNYTAISDSIDSTHGLTEFITNLVTVVWSEGLQTVLINEILELFDSTSPAQTLVVNVNELIPLSDSVGTVMISVITILEIIGLAAVVSTQQTATVSVLETIGFDSVVSTTIDLQTTVNETIALYDSTQLVMSLEQMLYEVIPFWDTVNTTSVTTVFIYEVIDLSDTVTTVLNGAVSLDEIIDLSDTVATAISQAVTINEVIDLFDSVTTVLGGEYYVTVYELIDLSDTVATAISQAVTINEVIDLYDSILPAFGGYVTVLESLPLADSISTILNANVQLLETIPLADTATTVFSAVVTISETIPFYDHVTAEIPIFSIVLNEIIPITSHVTVSGVPSVEEEGGLFYELFLSREPWGYLGPMAVVIGGYIVTNKNRFLGVLWFIMECLFIGHYLSLVEATPFYWWHIYILLLGGLFTIIYPLFEGGRRR